MTIMAHQENEAIEIDTPEEYTDLQEYDDLNNGDIKYHTIALISLKDSIFEEECLKVKASVAAKLFYLTH